MAATARNQLQFSTKIAIVAVRFDVILALNVEASRSYRMLNEMNWIKEEKQIQADEAEKALYNYQKNKS